MANLEPQGGPDTHPHAHKPRHLAERFESWMVIAMAIAGAGLLAVLLWAFMQTGSGTPPWMR
jgi:hypothetical protein